MLTSIYMKNFKCFEEYELDLKNLTLLTGYNGAGKSSSVQPLLLLSQILRLPPNLPVFSLNGPLVRLGSAGDVVSETASGATILGLKDDDQNSANWTFSNDRALSRGELRLEKSEFSYVKGESKSWAPDGDLMPFLVLAKEIIYIGATRSMAAEADLFPESNLVVGDVGPEGQWAGYWYSKQADEQVPLQLRHPEDDRETVRAQIDAWMNELFPDAKVNVEHLPDVSLSKTRFNLGRSNEWRRPSNVGFGLSYVFPILVALVCAKPNQIIIVDSPEAHLHPKAQSTMGRILCHFANNGVQIIIESHSDHLLSGIRLSIKGNVIGSSDTTVYFFDPGQKGTDPTRQVIEIAADGSISDWPAGFFDQAITDLVGLS